MAFKSGTTLIFIKSMPPAMFEYLKQDRDVRLDRYVSRTAEDVIKGYDGFYAVIYDALFEKDHDVILRMVFRREDPHQISGLWFNKCPSILGIFSQELSPR